MACHYLPFEGLDYLSKSDKAYAQGATILQPFYKYPVNLEAFKQAIADKSKETTNRSVLVDVLKEQYNGVATSEAVINNIDKLASNNTFTIITAHQPSLFTGPLYFIYKTISAINLAEQLQAAYPAYNFVPVFYLGSEDHDFEEINHLHLFGKTFTWENDAQGPTGMMDTDSLSAVLAELEPVLGNSDNAQTIFQLLKDCYQSGVNYAEATFRFTNALFKQYGLVVSLTNNAALKRLFIPIMKDELIHQSSKNLVAAEQEKKVAVGLKAQAFPREINLFYMKKGMRERIVEEEGIYSVLNTDLTFTKAEILAELEANPQHFSPNVVMRPLYQELIFPNLAYIGGGGELAYWRERMTQFDYFKLNFPMLVRRDSVLWIDKGSNKRLNKLGLSVEAIFGDIDALIRDYVDANSKGELTIAEEKTQLATLFDAVSEKAKVIDPTLAKAVLSEKTKQLKAINQLETRLMRAEKKKHETAINQMRKIKDKLFPNNSLQERYDNFLAFYLKYGDNFITTLKQHLNPLNKDFKVIVEE